MEINSPLVCFMEEQILKDQAFPKIQIFWKKVKEELPIPSVRFTLCYDLFSVIQSSEGTQVGVV